MSWETRFELLSEVVETATASAPINERLEAIIRAIHSHFKPRASFLLRQEPTPEAERMVLCHCWPPEQMPQGEVELTLEEGEIAEALKRGEPVVRPVEGHGHEPLLRALGNSGEVGVVVPIMDDATLYGALVLMAPDSWPRPQPQEMVLLQMAARETAGALRGHYLYTQAQRRITELNVLSDLGKAAVSTIDAPQLMNLVARMCAKLLDAQGGMVRIWPTRAGGKVMEAIGGSLPGICTKGDKCYNQCSPAPSPPLTRVTYCPTAEGQRLCASLSFKGPYQGRLCVVRSESDQPFGPEELKLLKTMASMVSPALDNALAFQRIEELAQRNEEMVGALATLHEIATVLMTTVDFDQTLQIILHSLTHPAGLGYDKALVLLTCEILGDQREGLLIPVGSMQSQAHQGQVCELTNSLLRLAGEGTCSPRVTPPKLKDFAVALDDSTHLAAHCLRLRKPIRVENPAEHPGLGPELLEEMGSQPLVLAPMLAKGKPIGVIVANRSRQEPPLTERDLKVLAMLATQGALALETSRLYQNLEKANRELADMRSRLLEAEKLAALGEMAAGVAHEIRNPLMSIGGFAKRVRKKMADDQPLAKYMDVIIEDVTRLEHTLKEMLALSTDSRETYEEHQLADIIDEAIELLKRDIAEKAVEVLKDYHPELPPVLGDDRQLKHVFYNLLLNAIQAMDGGGRITLKTFPMVREGKQMVAAEVADTGGGIPPEVMHNIFNPFFTTKDSGTGLGLAIVHKIVTRHFGEVEVYNKEGEGAVFRVCLPAAEESRAYYLK